jgi:hypothetical protein
MPVSETSALSVVSLLKPGAELGLMYADALVKTIPADLFAKMPAKDINSPAFNIGHLSLYPDTRILPLMGREDLIRPLPYAQELFKAGTPCVDEPGKYPDKDTIYSWFTSRYRVAIDALSELTEERLMMQNPFEGRLREVFPTVGAGVSFMLLGHVQTHLGQVSTWRRIMGLGSAF